jgi:hypothetical protein
MSEICKDRAPFLRFRTLVRSPKQDDPTDAMNQILVRVSSRSRLHHSLFDDQSTERMANEYEGSIGDMRALDILDIMEAEWMLSSPRSGSAYLDSHVVYAIQQSPGNVLKSILGELWPKPSGLVVEAEDASAHAGGVVSKRSRQKIGQPSYINLDTLVWIPVADPSMIWVGTKTMHRDDTYTPLVSKES